MYSMTSWPWCLTVFCVCVADTVDLFRLCQQSSALARQSTCDAECLHADEQPPCHTAYIPGVSKTSGWLGCVWGLYLWSILINSADLVACMASTVTCTRHRCGMLWVGVGHNFFSKAVWDMSVDHRFCNKVHHMMGPWMKMLPSWSLPH